MVLWVVSRVLIGCYEWFSRVFIFGCEGAVGFMGDFNGVANLL